MELKRTTLRLRPALKKAAEKRALEADVTLQEVFNKALSEYLSKKAEKKSKSIVFKTHNLGFPLNNLRRSDYYEDAS